MLFFFSWNEAVPIIPLIAEFVNDLTGSNLGHGRRVFKSFKATINTLIQVSVFSVYFQKEIFQLSETIK